MTHPMPLAVYMDVHVPASVSEALRRKQIDVRTAQGTPIGRLIEDAELCLAGTTADEFCNRLVHLPLR